MATSAPSSRHSFTFSSLPAVVITRAPSAFDICTTIEPTPPVPPLTNSVSPAFNRAVAHEAEVCGDAHERAGGGGFVGHAVGNGIEPALVDRGILGKCALPAEESLVAAPHAVADFESLRVWAELLDDAGQVAADDERQRDTHLDRAGADVRIDRVECGGLYAHQHLAAGGLGRGQVADDDVFGRARLLM